MLTVKGASCQG